MSAKKLKKEGSEEIEEDNQTTRWKEAKSNLEEGGENHSIINKKVGSTSEQGDH